MKKNGYVVWVNDKVAKIRVNRESACGANCSGCKGCKSDEILFEIENSMELKAGETVKVIMDDSKFLKKTFLGYGLLVVLIILGGILGYTVSENELISLVFILISLTFGVIILKNIFKDRFSDIKVERF